MSRLILLVCLLCILPSGCASSDQTCRPTPPARSELAFADGEAPPPEQKSSRGMTRGKLMWMAGVAGVLALLGLFGLLTIIANGLSQQQGR